MRRWMFLVVCAAWLGGAGRAVAQTPTEALDLRMPAGKEPLRFEVAIQGASPSKSWDTFLDRWFEYFDADESNSLSKAEASRIFPLPLPSQKNVAFDFAKADANGDGAVTRAEMKAFYRSGGFRPVLAVAEAVSLQNLRLADSLFRHLGPDASGKLSLERFKQAPGLLRKLDENENEVLTPAEILSIGTDPALKASNSSDFRWLDADKKPGGATIKLFIDDAPKPQLRLDPIGKNLLSIASLSNATSLRLRYEKALLAFTLSDANAGKAVATSRQFVVAQFSSIAGKSASIEERQVQDDASLQLLADVFPHADRNQDGKLTLVELERFLGLIEQGVNAPVLVTLSDHGRNLFLHLDANADSRLDLGELNSAWRQVVNLSGENGWTRTDVPHCVQITLQRGFAADAFGPLPLASPSRAAKGPLGSPSRKGPAWFQAMDKNGDSLVSPREFLGPLELFRQLDRNGDGQISVEEAGKAQAR